ncbi:competence/damage-inducible protein A [Myceligenerans indicum]|uniref:Competence/damage-inducible protein A n=1 Tax=Myceligenerans indicum TaxID=2593663 RepID=A0ABS1LPY8_9MICO|nr:competence/damage-inducible protein A [Myceligenerans indicum]MBL0887853.1 competence/damage-inducible protein A [Myceligenerans indicum]
MSVAVLVVGNEILDGSTVDTNSGWVCGRISDRGAAVVRTAVVADDEAEIAAGVDFLRAAGPRLLITVGGLGPTRDDMTVAAVATHLGVPLAEDAAAARIVERQYAALAARGGGRATTSEVRDARAKMARLPQGAHALDNQIGSAPGVWLDHEELAVLNLPGVPAEMKDIFTGSADVHLRRVLGDGHVRSAEVVIRTNDESEIAGSLAAFDARHGGLGVYLKSRARQFGGDLRLQATISARGADPDDVENRLESAIDGFTTILAAAGIDVLAVTRDA